MSVEWEKTQFGERLSRFRFSGNVISKGSYPSKPRKNVFGPQ